MFASGAVHGVAFADGAGPIATKKPMAVTDTTDSDRTRGIAVKVIPFQERAAAFDVRSGSCDDSDSRGFCDQ
jgi:hypothetical protein